MSPSSKRILFVVSPVIVVLVAIIGVFAFNNEHRFENNADLLKQSYKLLEASDNTYALVQSLESSSDNYLFTGDEVSLSDFKTGVGQLLISLDTLKHRTRNEAALKPGVDSLDKIINRHISFIDGYLNLVNAKEFSKDEQQDYVRFNKYYRDRINTILSGMLIEENGQFNQREEENDKSISNYHLVFSTLRIGTFLLLVSLIVLLVRNSNK